jgi:hypothetical protein
LQKRSATDRQPIDKPLLMVANKTAPPQGLNAVLIDAFIAVAFGTIIHFHAIPGVALDTGNSSAPNINAIPGDAIFFINRQAFRFADMPVTDHTVNFSHFHMGRMGEEYILGLP